MTNKYRTMYWSHFQNYTKCPQKYLWTKGWPGIDLGAGPGKKKPVTMKRSEHHALMGIVIQGVLEDFYNEGLWKILKGKELERDLARRTVNAFEDRLEKSYINWSESPSKKELKRVCLEGVLNFLKTLKHNRLLGSYARSEVEVMAFIDDTTPIGGRIDFLIKKGEDILILDGKNSKQKKYVDPDQLVFYALLFLLAYKKIPTKVGFVFFRYPYGTPIEGSEEVESGVDWHEIDKDKLKGMAQRIVTAKWGMVNQEFDPNPSPQNCRFCDYENQCDARKTQKAYNRKNRKPRKPKVSPLRKELKEKFKKKTFTFSKKA